MKLLLPIWIWVCLALPVMAQNAIINCSSTNLLQVYSTSTPSLLTAYTLIHPAYKGHLSISNPTSVAICASGIVSATPPAVANKFEHCVAPTTTEVFTEVNWPIDRAFYIYLRADASNCTSGTFYVDYW